MNIVWLAKQKLSFCMVDCSFGSKMGGGGASLEGCAQDVKETGSRC